jgi:hypothetical protein
MTNAKPWFVPEEPAEDRICGKREREVYVIVDRESASASKRPRGPVHTLTWGLLIILFLGIFAVFVAALKWESVFEDATETDEGAPEILGPLDR